MGADLDRESGLDAFTNATGDDYEDGYAECRCAVMKVLLIELEDMQRTFHERQVAARLMEGVARLLPRGGWAQKRRSDRDR